MTTHGALIPPAYLPDSVSFCTYTWGKYPFAIFCHFWGPSSSHNPRRHLLSVFDHSFLTCSPNSGLKESHYHIGQTVDKDVDKDIYCWQGCSCPTFSGGSCLTTLESSVLRINLMAIKAKSFLARCWTRCYSARFICSHLSFSFVPGRMKREHLGLQVLQSWSSVVILSVLQPYPGREI